MSKILAVFGATGQQGNSVIDFVLHDPELSKTYSIRAITRDTGSPAAKQLKEKVEVVQGDMSDPASLPAALTGTHTVFAMTNPDFGPNGLQTELNSGKAIADAAVAAGATYIVFSTLPHTSEISGGKYTNITHHDAKALAERYIRTLPIQSAFVSLGMFMQNFHNIPFLAPQRASDGSDTWVMARHNSPQTMLPLVDAVADTGKFVGAILAAPDKYQGSTFCAATALYSLADVAAIMARATGKNVVYKQVSLEEFRDSLKFGREIFPQTFSCPEEFGFYGPKTEELVAWAAGNARGRVTTFEEYLRAHPLVLT